MALLYSWLGMSDLRLISVPEAGVGERGPVFQALAHGRYARLVLLSNSSRLDTGDFITGLRRQLARLGQAVEIDVEYFELEDPTDYPRIYLAARDVLDRHHRPGDETWFHLSPGTPAMASVWMVLSQSSHPARLIQTSRERGLREVELPFILAARERSSISELMSDLMVRDRAENGDFAGIIHADAAMKRLIEKARKAARFDVPVLVSGESGTGKELLCRAIHRASPRSAGPFVPVNCGAIPAELMESQFFGHVRGAFTGADRDHRGVFEEARGGTLFLDEIGELPAGMQVKLLRALQEGEVRPVGADSPVRIDVRILAATNRRLADEIGAGNFRADLYYRLAVAGLHIPPLRQRSGDIPALTRQLLSAINREFAESDERWEDRDLAPETMDFIVTRPWPGNIRQLINSLKQAALWSTSLVITPPDIADALDDSPYGDENRGGGEEPAYPDLQSQLDAVARRRIIEVLEKHGGHKGRSAAELGFANHQTLSNWMSRLGIEYTLQG
jgi:transcriptional regulator with PAS, ATPase and Fis domain